MNLQKGIFICSISPSFVCLEPISLQIILQDKSSIRHLLRKNRGDWLELGRVPHFLPSSLGIKSELAPSAKGPGRTIFQGMAVQQSGGAQAWKSERCGDQTTFQLGDLGKSFNPPQSCLFTYEMEIIIPPHQVVVRN